jgi:hypothetical protein
MGAKDSVNTYDAEQDLRRAIALDPEFGEAHEIYAELMAYNNRDYDAALGEIDIGLGLGRCDRALEDWDYDCGAYYLTRANIYAGRLQPGDLDAAEADVERVAPVTALTRRREDVGTYVFNQRVGDSLLHSTCTKAGRPVACDFTTATP